MSKVTDSLGQIENRIEEIYVMLKMMAGNPQSSRLTQSHSPISLNELGKEIAANLDFDNILDTNWDKIESIIDDEKNPYDIQMEFITKFITSPEKYINTDALDKIKNDAYLRGIPLIDYMRVIGIMARDKYFELHDIDINDVDRNNPNLS